MARNINRLKAPAITGQLAPNKMHPDGGGLFLLVSGTDTRSWVFRYMMNYKRRDLGLGAATRRDEYGRHTLAMPLSEARKAANDARMLILAGTDPVEHKRANREASKATATAAATAVVTWGEVREAYVAEIAKAFKLTQKEVAEGVTVGKQEKLWRARLEVYGPKADTALDKVNTALVVELLKPIWHSMNPTASRVRGYCERIWDSAEVQGKVSGKNPFRYTGHLDKLGFANPTGLRKKKTTSFKPIAYTELPAFMRELAQRKALSARALEFTIYTACRTNETIYMERSDVKKDLWHRPAHKMKMAEEHVVTLSKAALAALAQGEPGNKPFPLSNNAMLYLVTLRMEKKFTVHGMRSAFMDWSYNETDAPEWLVEECLSHAIGGVKKHYRHEDALTKRRAHMEAWAAFLSGK